MQYRYFVILDKKKEEYYFDRGRFRDRPDEARQYYSASDAQAAIPNIRGYFTKNGGKEDFESFDLVVAEIVWDFCCRYIEN